MSENAYVRYSDLSKYQIFRAIWDDLDRAKSGRKVQRDLITALANLDAPEPKAPDQDAGRQAIEDLRRLAQQANLLVSPEEIARQQRREATASLAAESSAKREQLTQLNSTFRALHSETDKQSRGYKFEKLLTALFRHAELEYHGSYKTDTDQIDGAVVLDAFTALHNAGCSCGLNPPDSSRLLAM